MAEDLALNVPNYEIIRLIGSGGMGDVYEGRHVVLNTSVAIKLLRSHLVETQALLRFQQEAQAASRLNHVNIVRVFDCGVMPQGTPYMIMDLVKGETLEAVIKEGSLNVRETLETIKQICNGVRCAHENGILHRDLKPSNIILEKQGDKTVARVLDFGIAKIMEDEDGLLKTRTGEIFGTPAYMSPEQASGTKVDQRSDIYAIGCILYEMLTGQPPAVGKTAIEVLFKQVNETPLPLTQASLGKKFPTELEQIVDRCLAKDPAARFASLAEVLEAIEDFDAGRPMRFSLGENKQHIKAERKIFVITSILIAALLVVAGLVIRNQILQTHDIETAAKTSHEDTATTASQHVSDSDHASKSAAGDFPNESDDSFAKMLKKMGPYAQTLDHVPSEIHDESLKLIGNCPHLNSIDLTGCTKLTIVGLSYLDVLENLQILSIADTTMGDKAIAEINMLTKLRRLNLSGTGITATGVQKLSSNLPLERLDLSNTNIRNAALRNFKRFKSLQELNLNDCLEIGDDGLEELIGPQLQFLLLKRTFTSDKVVDWLKQMPNLRELSLSKAPRVSNQLLEQIIKVKAVPKLVYLNLRECERTTDAAKKEFHKLRPKCMVE
jgi:serine/threonine protein kinase